MGEVNAASRFGFFRFGVADLVFLFFAVTILQRAHHGMLDDPGLGWQIRIADAMIEKGGFLDGDPFGSQTQGRPWLPWGFLGSALLRLANGWAGLRGLAVLTTLLLALVLRCLYRMMIRDEVPWPQALLWTYLAALGTSSAWVTRPNLYTLFFQLMVVRVCVQFHRGRMSVRRAFLLVPMFALWANMHGGFPAGLMTIGAAGLIEVGIAFVDHIQRPAAWARFRWFTLLGVGCLAATLINPYGWGLHVQIVRLLRDPFMMNNLNADWLSPDFHATGAFRIELLILLLPLLLAISRRRPDAVSLGLSLVWLHFALDGRRYAPLWVLTVVPLLASQAAGTVWMQRLSDWLDEKRREAEAAAAPSPVPAVAMAAPWFWSVVIAVGLFVSARYVGNYAGHAPQHMPTAALDELLKIQHGETTFHSINWGGYLTWNGWDRQPRFLTWIDDRNELQGQARIEEWQEITATAPGWRRKLERANVRLVCVEASSPLAWRLGEDGDWQEVYRDEEAVIFRREGEAKKGSRVP